MKIQALLTEVHAHGGIQRYNQQLLTAVRSLAGDGEVQALSLNDRQTCGGIRGFGRRRGAFLRAALRGAAGQPGIAIIGHVNLAGLALAYRIVAPRTRTYVIAHGKEVEERLPLLGRMAIRSATGVICVSESTRFLMVRRQAVRRERAHVVRYGFEPPMEDTTPAAGSPDEIAVLSVARLNADDAYKGIDVTIEAIAQLRERLPGLRYTVAGDGDDRSRLQALAARLGIGDRVTFTGNVSDGELSELYRRCDIFALPSTHEGLGIVYLEAMARGKPVIAVRAGGVADAVVHEGNGILLERADAYSVSAALSQLAEDRDFRVRLGNWARVHTAHTFSSASMARALNTVLQTPADAVHSEKLSAQADVPVCMERP